MAGWAAAAVLLGRGRRTGAGHRRVLRLRHHRRPPGEGLSSRLIPGGPLHHHFPALLAHLPSALHLHHLALLIGLEGVLPGGLHLLLTLRGHRLLIGGTTGEHLLPALEFRRSGGGLPERAGAACARILSAGEVGSRLTGIGLHPSEPGRGRRSRTGNPALLARHAGRCPPRQHG